jgi:Uma2 family endonuclease
MATTTAPASAEEYLHSSFEHDAEYVDGRIVPRPMPQKPRSKMAGRLYEAFLTAARPLGYKIWIEQRIRTQEDPPHYRVPDLCLTVGEPADDTFTEPPFLCIEILSPDDAFVELQAKVREYLAFGVSYVWIVDPVTSTGQIHTSSGLERVENGLFRAGEIQVQL